MCVFTQTSLFADQALFIDGVTETHMMVIMMPINSSPLHSNLLLLLESTQFGDLYLLTFKFESGEYLERNNWPVSLRHLTGVTIKFSDTHVLSMFVQCFC